MKVVLDTNILISACWKPGGNEARVLALAIAGELKIALSPELFDEYREVAARKKFAKQRDSLEAVIGQLQTVAEPCEPTSACDVCADPDDNVILDCALAGNADCVVTGNLRDFPQTWPSIEVINARQLLERISPGSTSGPTLPAAT